LKQDATNQSILNRLLGKAMQRYIPLTILFELTYRCNLKCSHCYLANRKEAGLPQEIIEGILDQLAEEGTLFLILSGGEIFMREDFFQIARYARNKGFALELFTNGTLIDEAAADEIAELAPWRVEISIYGATKDTHDSITGISGSWEKSLKAIKLLKAREINVSFKTLWMKENIAEAESLLQLKEELDIGFRSSALISPRSDGCSVPLSHRLDDQQLIFLNQLLRRYSDTKIDEPSTADSNRMKLSQMMSCGAGICYASISPAGEIYPCNLFPHSLGNLSKESFRQIWGGSPFLKKMRETHLSDLEECSTCPLIFNCPRCSAMAALEEGDWLKPWREACRIARIASKEVAYEQEKEKVSKA
jgi:radical SAM protein with 4Fe4S-binding SPASM domain